jgi:hypothetical protein
MAQTKPTWYTAQLTLDKRQLRRPTRDDRTCYGAPWSTQDHSLTQVGTASFQPTNAYNAPGLSAVRPRHDGRHRDQDDPAPGADCDRIGGTYFGGQSGAYSGCTSIADNAAYTDAFNLQVTQPTSGNVTFQFTYASGLSCTLTGMLVQNGQLYTVPAANYSCSNGLNTNASMSEIKATSLGIEGRIAAPMVGGGCREDATLGGPLH